MGLVSANVNSILARWMTPATADAAELDCGSCGKRNKCCDFQPFVSNFLLGAILEEGGDLPETDGVCYQPLGLIPTAAFRARHAAIPEEERDGTLTCAFYTEGACSIWRHRPGECSTYLCTTPGRDRLSLSERAYRVETAVSQMALAYLGFSGREIARQIDFLNNPEQGITDTSKNQMRELYSKAWNWAKTVSADDVNGWRW